MAEVTCPACKGTTGAVFGPKRNGRFTAPSPFGNDPSNSWYDCTRCKGYGTIPEEELTNEEYNDAIQAGEIPAST